MEFLKRVCGDGQSQLHLHNGLSSQIKLVSMITSHQLIVIFGAFSNSISLPVRFELTLGPNVELLATNLFSQLFLC